MDAFDYKHYIIKTNADKKKYEEKENLKNVKDLV